MVNPRGRNGIIHIKMDYSGKDNDPLITETIRQSISELIDIANI